MTAKKKKQIMGVSVITVILAVVISGVVLYLYDNGLLPSSANNQMLEKALILYDSKDYEAVCNGYSALFSMPEFEEALAKQNADENSGNSYRAKYLVALLATKQKDLFTNKITEYLNALPPDDSDKLLAGLYVTIDNDFRDNATEYDEWVRALLEFNVQLDGDKRNIYYKSFLYFTALCTDAQADAAERLRTEMLQYFQETESDYNSFYEQERMLYTSLLLKSRNYEKFKSLFVKSFGENTPFTTKDIAYMINNMGFDDTQLSVLYDAMQELKVQTDIADQNKIKALDSLCDILIQDFKIGDGETSKDRE